VNTREEEVLEYRRILIEEVRKHRWSSRIILLRGLAFLVGGAAMIAADFVPLLGWLLLLGGLLQILNGVYELQREDELQGKLRLAEQKFGGH